MSPQNTFHLKLAYVEHTSEQCRSDVRIKLWPTNERRDCTSDLDCMETHFNQLNIKTDENSA